MTLLRFLTAGVLLAVSFAMVDEASAAKPTRKQLFVKRFDTDGDGKLSIPERGAARITVGNNRAWKAMKTNQTEVGRIR